MTMYRETVPLHREFDQQGERLAARYERRGLGRLRSAGYAIERAGQIATIALYAHSHGKGVSRRESAVQWSDVYDGYRTRDCGSGVGKHAARR